MASSAADLRRWAHARREAEAREADERARERPTAQESFERAARLIDLARARHGWPLPIDVGAVAEDERMYERWAHLHARMGRR